MYQVLARKYRPKNFTELVGQTHVSKALMGALDKQRLHHAYLFTGTRGVGKTTIARILSKCLNCETGITNTPCGECSVCRAIDAGQFIDLIEIDAASRTKVEDTRELLDQVPYAPTQGRYKVYLIDEVHMLSTHSFNALLKTLEEPPEHVKFLLATTDPQKLPITVMSRCLQFVLRPLPRNDIRQHLAFVLGQESISFDDEALWKLADSAQGSIRDALSLTDQAIAYGQGEVRAHDVDAMLGLMDATHVSQLLQAIYMQNKHAVAEHIATMRAQMVDAKAILDQCVELVFNISLLKDLPEVDLDLSAEALTELEVLAKQIDSAELQLYYQILVQGRADLKLASNPQQGLEMTLLRMLAFKPFSGHTQGACEQSSSEQALNRPVKASDESMADSPVSESQAKKKVLNSPYKPSQLDSQNKDKSVKNKSAAHDFNDLSSQPGYCDKTISDKPHVDNAPASNCHTDESDSVSPKKTTALPKTTVLKKTTALQKAQVQQPPVALPKPLQVHPKVKRKPDTGVNQPSSTLFKNEVDNGKANTKAADRSTDSNDHEAVKANTPSMPSLVDTATKAQTDPKKDENPLNVLKPKAVALEGAWTLAKWEYWLYNAKLKPEILNIAQKGVMTGTINGACVFETIKDIEVLNDTFFERLMSEIKTRWPHTQATIKKMATIDNTPEQNQSKRNQAAQRLAEAHISCEPLVRVLLEDFSANVANLRLLAGS